MLKIIVRVPNWLGDAVLSTPALYFLRERFPDSHIAVLAKEWVAPVFETNPDVQEIYVMKKGESRRSLAGRLKAAKFNLGVLFPNSFSSAFLFWLAGIPQRVGYATDGRSLLLTQRIKRPPHFPKEEHQVRYYLSLVREITGGREFSRERENKKLVWNVTEAERERAEKFLREAGISPQDRLMGINPGATYGLAKRWFPERFAQVGDELMKRYGVKIIVFGDSQERELADSLAQMMQKQPLNFAGRTNLRELAALISRCQMFVTNDTGNMHIAAAVGTPVAAIFGSTNPQKSAPWGNGHRVIQKKIACSPCMKKICPGRDYKCMEIIEVPEVLGAIEQQLQKIGGAG